MIGIEKIGMYLPDRKVENLSRCLQLGIEESFLKNKIGVETYSVKSDGQETSDLCLEAFLNLKNDYPLDIKEIGCIVVCTQNPDGFGLPHTAAILHAKLKANESCGAFDVSLGCSGYVYSLSIIKSFMRENNIDRGLLFTCDPYSKIIDPKDKNTALLFGDAATVTLMSQTPIWQIGISDWGTKGRDHRAIRTDENRRFNMNGRAVFNFAVQTVPKSIQKTLELNNTSAKDIDLFLLHQASRYVIDIIRKRLGVASCLLPFHAKTQGNTVSSSIPLLLANVEDGPQKVILCGFGVGLSWGTTLLTKNNSVG